MCDSCAHVHYVNPKVICGSVVTSQDHRCVLLCRRAIPPSIGLWTVPAGYQEVGESSQDAAEREVLEEAQVHIRLGPLLAVYDIVPASQVHLLYRSVLVDEGELDVFRPGPETLEIGLFAWGALPWDALAFSSVAWALTYARSTLHVPDKTLVPQIRCKRFPAAKM